MLLAALGKRDPDTGRQAAESDQVEPAKQVAKRIKRTSSLVALAYAGGVALLRLYVL